MWHGNASQHMTADDCGIDVPVGRIMTSQPPAYPPAPLANHSDCLCWPQFLNVAVVNARSA